jgi:hypothetical protein
MNRNALRLAVACVSLFGLTASLIAVILAALLGWPRGTLLRSAMLGIIVWIGLLEGFVRWDVRSSADLSEDDKRSWRQQFLGGAGVFALFAYLFRKDRRLRSASRKRPLRHKAH